MIVSDLKLRIFQKDALCVAIMSGNGLQAFRDKLTLVYMNDIVHIGDFVYLYYANQSKLSFSYCKFDEINLQILDDIECRTELRFRKTDIPILLNCLKIPETIVCS